MRDTYSLWPTWTSGTTTLAGPFANEELARTVADNMIANHGGDLRRLVLQRPDGSTVELIEEKP